MGRKGKLEIDFDTTCVLEVNINNKWYRVTSISFRSFDGLRRINEEEYIGPIYLYGFNTTVPFTNSCKVVYDPNSLPLVGKNPNPMKRCLP
jgi:hypothetical protein